MGQQYQRTKKNGKYFYEIFMLKAIFLSSPNGGYFTKQILDRNTGITLLGKSCFCFYLLGNLLLLLLLLNE